MKVKNKFIEGSPILIIGDFPSREDEQANTPLTNEILINTFANTGLSLNNISRANLSQIRPNDNLISSIEDSDEYKRGISSLRSYIEKEHLGIKVILCLGESVLNTICKEYGIQKWRGSVLRLGGIHYISTYSPYQVSRQRSLYPIFTFDIYRAIEISRKGYTAPINDFIIDPSGLDLEEIKSEILSNDIISIDIESSRDSTHILCCGFASSKSKAYCLVNHDYMGMEYSFYNATKTICENESVKKIFHNGLFDVEMLRLNGINVKNWTYDTMVGQHILEPEMEKSLAFLTSLYTDRPYYKEMGKDSDEKTWNSKIDKNSLYVYNCLDCVSTFEIYEKQILELKELKLWDLFLYEMELCEIALHIGSSGMLRDNERCNLIEGYLKEQCRKDQTLLNNIVGKEINVKSPKQLKDTLYTDMKLPTRKAYSGTVTTDENAIVASMAYVKEHISTLRTEDKIMEWSKKLVTLKLILKIRGYRQLLSNYINATFSSDGRIRSSYKVTGTETGRWACSMYVDGTGLNAQTFPREVLTIEDTY